jgi:ABC-type lipoprotein release transport system permease subunit
MVSYLAGIEVRRHWRSVLPLALLVALVVGTVLAATAGGRQSRTSFDRYLSRLNPPEALATAAPEDRHALDQVAALPMVAAAPAFELAAIFPSQSGEEFFPMAVSTDGLVPNTYLRTPVIAGRLADPDQPFEVILSERTARRLRAGVGDTIPMASLSPASADALNTGSQEDPPADGPTFELTVVGIVRDAGDIAGRSTDLTLTFLTPAFRDRFPAATIGSLAFGRFVVLRHDSDLRAFTDAASDLPVELDPSFSAKLTASQADPTMAAIATALYTFAAVAAVAGLATIGHAVGRMQSRAAADDQTLVALGVGRTGRWTRLMAPGGAAVAVGVPLGLVVAIAASPLFPIGLARRAELDVGVHVDGAVLAVGGLASLVAGLGLVALLGGLSARAAHGPERLVRPSRVLSRATSAGAPPAVVTGLTMALGSSRRGRSAASAAIAGTALGVLGVLAAIVFAASIDRLVSTPSLYGWGWDANIAGADLSDLGPDASPSALVKDPELRVVAQIDMQLEATINGEPVFLTSALDVKGHLEPVIVKGTEPVRADELAVGADTLEAVGASVGDRVRLDMGDGPRSMRVSGIVALPVSSDGGSSAVGAYLSSAAAKALQVSARCEGGSSCYRNLAIALTDRARLPEVVDRYEDPDQNVAVDLPAPPGEVERLTAVRQLPWYLAGLLGLLAAVAATYSAAIAVRRRRRDLAVLRVIGMSAAQLRGVVAVQVLVLAAAGGALGSLAGVLLGRQVWRWVTSSLAMPYSPAVPAVAALLVPGAAMVITQLAATFSRRAAGRTQPALALRTE